MSMKLALLAGVAIAAIAPAPASADPAREAELEARIRALEAAVGELRTELNAARAAPASAAPAPTLQAGAAPAATGPAPTATAEPVRTAQAPEGFRIGATTVRLNGFFKANTIVSSYSGGDVPGNALLRDFYLPQQIPVGGVSEGTDYDTHAKQTRIWLTTSTPLGSHTVAGHLEFDFQTAPGIQGSERTTNGYNLALRRAFINFDNRFLFGQEWSTLQNVAVLPETTDFVGPTEGTVFVRQPQIRFTHRLSPQVTLAVAAENPETASITTTSAALVENDDDGMPDVVARLSFAPSFGEFTLAGVVRQLSVDNGAVGDNASGYGISFAGKVPFGPGNRHDLRFMISGGDGIGRYLGLNFAPDAVLAGNRLEPVSALAGFAALRIGLTDQVRSTVMASFQDVDYPDLLIPAAANESAWSLAGNLFYSPVRNLDLGIEYRHGARTLVSGAEGTLDRVEAAARYNF